MQFSPYLLHLSGFKVSSYLEVGCAAGGTFMFVTEYLRRTNSLQFSTCVDLALPGQNTHSSEEENKQSPFYGILPAYLDKHPEYVSFFVGSSHEYVAKHPEGPVSAAGRVGELY